jgi:hypothetical protein
MINPASTETGQPTMVLEVEHQADLARSGLDSDAARAAGIRSLEPAEWDHYLPPHIAGALTSAYIIPYPAADDFYRVKLFPPVPGRDGRPMRYYQRGGTVPRLYLTPSARAVLADPIVPIWWTEGEKKCLAGERAGFVTIGLGGLWNWLCDGKPIADLDRVDHCGRTELLVPDSDVWTRPELLQPAYALAKELEARGAMVAVVKLPAGPGGQKVGLDDFLMAHPPADLDALPQFTLKAPVLARYAEWHKGWRARKAADANGHTDALALLERAESVRTLHPAHDVADGVLWYGVVNVRTLVMVNSARQGFAATALPTGVDLRHTDLTESTVTPSTALSWLGGTAAGSVAKTLDALLAYFGHYMVLRPGMAMLLATWTLGTWTYRAFRICPYLSLRSPEKRCGKSRLLSLLQRVTFNAGPVTAMPTEAQLFRGAARTGGTQLLDEVEALRGDKDRFEALISVLNVGFERGAVVARLEKRGERFVEVPHEVYVPRALAGIAGLSETLTDRSLPIFMARRRRDEQVARLTGAIEPEAAALRDACALACLEHIGNIAQAYERAPALLERETALDDRAVDLWAPLVALTLVADAEDQGDRTTRLLALARELSGIRDADADDGQTARLITALETIRGTRGEMLAPGDLLAALQGHPGWEWVKTPRRLAGLLNPLGLYRERRREGGRLRWIYHLKAECVADLHARYGAPETVDSEAES